MTKQMLQNALRFVVMVALLLALTSCGGGIPIPTSNPQPGDTECTWTHTDGKKDVQYYKGDVSCPVYPFALLAGDEVSVATVTVPPPASP